MPSSLVGLRDQVYTYMGSLEVAKYSSISKSEENKRQQRQQREVMSCQESVCMYTHLSPPTQLLAAFLSQVKSAQPSTGRLQGLAVVPHTQGGFTTHIPFPWLSSSAIAPGPFPNTADTWPAQHPTTTAPHFHMAKVPSRPSLLAPDVSH